MNTLPEGIMETFDPELKRAFQVDDEITTDMKEKAFKKNLMTLQKGHLKVSGDMVFYTIQGEGPTMGFPAIFLRLKICNLRCVWCDAWYTWNPKSKEFWTEGEDWNIEKSVKIITDSWKCTDNRIPKRLIITGGEPLLQKEAIDELIKALPDWTIEIETNGTIMPTEYQLQRCQFNCSPKLKNSENLDASRIKPEVLKALNKVNTDFKFVVMDSKELDEIEKDFIVPFGLDVKRIILMPQGVQPEEIRMNMRNVIEYAKIKGYRLLSRLQVEIWGARRKV